MCLCHPSTPHPRANHPTLQRPGKSKVSRFQFPFCYLFQLYLYLYLQRPGKGKVSRSSISLFSIFIFIFIFKGLPKVRCADLQFHFFIYLCLYPFYLYLYLQRPGKSKVSRSSNSLFYLLHFWSADNPLGSKLSLILSSIKETANSRKLKSQTLPKKSKSSILVWNQTHLPPWMLLP